MRSIVDFRDPKEEGKFYENFIQYYSNKELESLTSLILTKIKTNKTQENSTTFNRYLQSLVSGMTCTNKKTVDEIITAFYKLMFVSEIGVG